MYKKFSYLSLPNEVEINGFNYEFNSDYRTVLKIFKVLNMGESEALINEKYYCCTKLFYKEDIKPIDYQDSIECMLLFLNGGKEETEVKEKPQLIDWEMDIDKIIPPISKSLGKDIRGIKNLHWWSFLSEFMEIGECRFSTYVSIRKKKAEHKKLEKWEEDFYKENKNEIDIVTKEEKEILDYTKELMEQNQKAINRKG